MLASIAQDSFFHAPDEATQRLQRKRLIMALSVAVLAHAVVLVAMALPPRFKLGIDRADPVMTRWIELPATPAAGVAREEPAPDTPAQPRAEAPAQPKPRPERTRPTPRSTRDDNNSSSTQVAQAPTDAASAASSPLPEGQDPLRMLPTTPERFQMLDRLSRDVDADPSMFAPGNAISVTVDLNGQPKLWRFIIVAEESIRSMGGLDVPTLRLLHYPENDRDDRVEVWLVPQLAYRPIQINVTPPGTLTSQNYTARIALDQLDEAARAGRVPGAAPATNASGPASPASR